MGSPLIAKYQPKTTTPASSHKENLGVVKTALKGETSKNVAKVSPAAPPPWSIGGKR
jgi:hypothetical protein